MATGQHQTADQPPSSGRVVLFDFDGTLVRGDNGTRMILAFARSRGWPFIPLLLATPIILPVLFFPPSKRLGASMYLWLSTVGMHKQQIKRCLKRLAKFTASRPERYRIDAAWQRLRAHQAAGDRIVVVTGCWESMAKKILKNMGLHGVSVIGSRKKRWMGGFVSQPHCYGTQKIVCLAAHGIHPPWNHVYTDSASDRHLLILADNPVLVRPSPYTRARIRGILGQSIEVIK